MLITPSAPPNPVSLPPPPAKSPVGVPGAPNRPPRISTRPTTARASPTRASTAAASCLVTTPAFFLHALDAKTGQPLENWGGAVPVAGFPKTGSVDLLKDLIADWEPWLRREAALRRRTRACRSSSATSPPRRRRSSSTTCSSSATPPSRATTRRASRTCRATSSAYDARTGKFLWKFHVIPRPGEFGHETWENDAWKWTGDVSSWAPMSADPERGLVYIPTNGATIDYYGGFRPGDNLFSTSVIALDVKTGKRVWHHQLVKHDIWNYDTPTAPILLDVNVNGRRSRACSRRPSRRWVYSFNRQTGEPIWPIEMRPVPQSKVPARSCRRRSRIPTKPAPFDLQGRTERHLIDYTPEIRKLALERRAARATCWRRSSRRRRIAATRKARRADANICPGGGGGANITGPPAADPTTGVIFITSTSGCSPTLLAPAKERDNAEDDRQDAVAVGRRAARRRRGAAAAKPATQRSAGRHSRPLQGAARPDRRRST